MNQDLETCPHAIAVSEIDASKRPMTGAERVAKIREKERLIKEGKYVPTAL